MEHTVFKCTRWKRLRLEAEAEIEIRLNPENLLKYMMATKENWKKGHI